MKLLMVGFGHQDRIWKVSNNYTTRSGVFRKGTQCVETLTMCRVVVRQTH